MQSNYEIAYGRIIPAFRRAVAREMYTHYHLKQADIAKRLGITQAAVSKYISSPVKAGSDKFVTDFVKASIDGHVHKARESMCKACQSARKFDCAFMFKQ